MSKKGEKPIDGITDLNPEGLTAVTGKWASDLQARLSKGGLKCHVLDKETWTVAMLEKHIWICAFMAVGAKYKGITVGDVEKLHTAEVRSLIEELTHAATIKTKVNFPAGVADRLCAYARSVAHFPTALKEQEWRNGWFCDVTFTQASRLMPDPCPSHTTIMSNQKLLMPARKRWVAKTDARLEATRAIIQQQRERGREEQAIASAKARRIKEVEARQRAARGEREIPPLTTSPTILKNKGPRVAKMIAEHEAAMQAYFEAEDRRAEEQEHWRAAGGARDGT